MYIYIYVRICLCACVCVSVQCVYKHFSSTKPLFRTMQVQETCFENMFQKVL